MNNKNSDNLLEKIYNEIYHELDIIIPNKRSFEIFKSSFLKEIDTKKINSSIFFRILLHTSLKDTEIQKYLFHNYKEIHYFDKETSMTNLTFIIDNKKVLLFLDKDLTASKRKIIEVNEKEITISLFNILWDVTENLNKVQSTQIQRDFINICAHELKSPLHPIMLQCDILLKNTNDSKNYKMIESIYNNAKRLGRIVDDLLEMTRIESDILQLNKESFRLNDLLQDIISASNKTILNDMRNRDLKINYKDSDMIFFINADKDRLSQALMNIINNSIKFTEKGSIDIQLEKHRKDSVKISISDTGKGIESNILPKLFTKFFTTSTKGLGLGLYISKNIIESHKGTIWVESNKNISSGSTFNIILPGLISQKESVNQTILLIDNDKEFANSLKFFLQKLEYKIDIFTSLSLLEKEYVYGFYSLIIVNPTIDQNNGFNIIQKIQNKENIKVCFLTEGKTNYESFSRIYGIENDEVFINKSLKIEDIVRIINSFFKS